MRTLYFKAVCSYGHMGSGKEISVARYIETFRATSIIEAIEIVSSMPGIKTRGIKKIEKIDEETYIKGKLLEKEDLFLQKLKTFKTKKISKEANAICA